MQPRFWPTHAPALVRSLVVPFVPFFVLSAGLATLIACDSAAPIEQADSAPAATQPAPRAEPTQPPTRRILPNCDPIKAARAATPALGSPARLRFLWNGRRPQAVPQDIPVLVKEVRESTDPPLVVIEIAPIPERARLIEITRESGHLRVEDDEILIDPCSATLFLN
jgi:hypothetical protein